MIDKALSKEQIEKLQKLYPCLSQQTQFVIETLREASAEAPSHVSNPTPGAIRYSLHRSLSTILKTADEMRSIVNE